MTMIQLQRSRGCEIIKVAVNILWCPENTGSKNPLKLSILPCRARNSGKLGLTLPDISSSQVLA